MRPAHAEPRSHVPCLWCSLSRVVRRNRQRPSTRRSNAQRSNARRHLTFSRTTASRARSTTTPRPWPPPSRPSRDFPRPSRRSPRHGVTVASSVPQARTAISRSRLQPSVAPPPANASPARPTSYPTESTATGRRASGSTAAGGAARGSPAGRFPRCAASRVAALPLLTGPDSEATLSKPAPDGKVRCATLAPFLPVSQHPCQPVPQLPNLETHLPALERAARGHEHEAQANDPTGVRLSLPRAAHRARHAEARGPVPTHSQGRMTHDHVRSPLKWPVI